jgi:hypothetical protein
MYFRVSMSFFAKPRSATNLSSEEMKMNKKKKKLSMMLFSFSVNCTPSALAFF